ncbi:MAG: hypothetical protein UCO74_03430 [Ruminococcus sp.]|uniref:hypothetical protein n=1 Tax=Ruminococcus sp. TaxID=41978 RepID=UPI002E78A698|nr:hypothetical protein [Ruminococcus sp.]MEE0600169.1 hypothetical protein [Ruminococcus sp.]
MVAELLSTECISNTSQTLENAWFTVLTAGVTVTENGQSYCQPKSANVSRFAWLEFLSGKSSRNSLKADTGDLLAAVGDMCERF